MWYLFDRNSFILHIDLFCMEKLLYYMWEHRLLGHAAPQTTDGRLIEVIDPGRRNVDAGPDSFNAKVRIGDRVWAGNVEMHLRSSDGPGRIDTTKTEPTDSVILHVVTEA